MNNVFKALSDKTRREILIMLRSGDMTAGDIAANFNMTKPSISHHLSILKGASLVTDVKEGQNVIYSLNTTVFSESAAFMMDFLNHKKGE